KVILSAQFLVCRRLVQNRHVPLCPADGAILPCAIYVLICGYNYVRVYSFRAVRRRSALDQPRREACQESYMSSASFLRLLALRLASSRRPPLRRRGKKANRFS